MAFTQRSEETRSAILTAARRRFAGDGYERATIRAIASDAGIDPSMVMRYYGSKEGLFAAAVDVDLRLPPLTGLPPSRMGEALVRHFLTLWEDGATDEGRGAGVLILLLRSAVTNEAAADRVRTVFASQVASAVGDLDDGETRGALVASQLLGLALCRYILLLPPVVSLSPETLITTVGATVQNYLTAPMSGHGGAATGR